MAEVRLSPEPLLLLESMQVSLGDIEEVEGLYRQLSAVTQELIPQAVELKDAQDFYSDYSASMLNRGQFDLLNWARERLKSGEYDQEKLALAGYAGNLLASKTALIDSIQDQWREGSTVQAWLGSTAFIYRPQELEDRESELYDTQPPNAMIYYRSGSAGSHSIGNKVHLIGQVADLSLYDNGTIVLEDGIIQITDSEPNAFKTVEIKNICDGSPELSKGGEKVFIPSIDITTRPVMANAVPS